MTDTHRTAPGESAPSVTIRPARWFVWLMWAALAAYGLYLARYLTVAAGGSDSSGYLNSARLITEGRLLEPERIPPEMRAAAGLNRFQFKPHGFTPLGAEGYLTPTYPVGLPLHLALAGKVLGWTAGTMAVEMLAALGTILLCYLAARELRIAPGLAAAGAVALAASPLYIFSSIQPLSDTMAATWTLAALTAALRCRRLGLAGDPASKNTTVGKWALASGAAFAMAVMVRPTNVLYAPALLVLFGFNFRNLSWFILGGVPGAIGLGWYNHALYGSPFTSGYGSISYLFDRGWFLPTSLHFAKWLAVVLPPVLLVLPLVAVARDPRRRELVALALAFFPITGLYAFYTVSHEAWWCLRFILPAVPPLILAGLIGIESMTRNSPRARVIAALVLGLWAAINGAHQTKILGVRESKQHEDTFIAGAELIRERVPANAVVFSMAFSGTLYFYTDLVAIRYDEVDPTSFADYASRALSAGRPIYAALFDWEKEEALEKRCPGAWRQVGTVRNVSVWKLDAAPAASIPPAR